MDFEDAKENIQPLASGRNASVLACSLSSHSELQKQREELEDAIKNYEGDDPLEPWYEYILWIEQSYPSGGSESGLKKVLLKCLLTFEEDKRYYQDRRMIRIYIKYIDTEENPIELYQELFKSGIGSMIADLYICWAYYYDLAGNFQKADSIFKKGLELRAQPYEELEQAHKHFGFTMSQRILNQDESSKEEFMSSMRERRQALTSLRPHKKKVGSIRTGSAVKSSNPGKIKIDEDRASAFPHNRNAKVAVFEDENKDPNLHFPSLPEEHHIPVVRNIIDSVRKQENMKEPGPWTKGLKKKGNLFGSGHGHTHEIGFKILEDDNEEASSAPENTDLPKLPECEIKGITLPPNFAKRNYPQGVWNVEMVADNEVKPQAYPQYNKFLHYPKPGVEFSSEEVYGYKWFKRHDKVNTFTEACKQYFDEEISIGVRFYKNFSKKNFPDKNNLKLSDFKCSVLPNTTLIVDLEQIYVGLQSGKIVEEKSFEEIFFEKFKSGERKLKFDADDTIIVEERMDETTCFTDIVGRKSIFPSRKSMAPFGADRKSILPGGDHERKSIAPFGSDRKSIFSAGDHERKSIAPLTADKRHTFKPTFAILEEHNRTESDDTNDSEQKTPETIKENRTSVITENADKSEHRQSVITENCFRTPMNEKKMKASGSISKLETIPVAANLSFPKVFKNISPASNDVPTSTNHRVISPLDKENVILPLRSNLHSEPIKSTEIYEDVPEIPMKSIIPDPFIKPGLVLAADNRVEETEAKIEKKISENFEIFEDPEESFKFKQPQPIKNVLQVKLPVPAFEFDAKEEFCSKPTSDHQGFAADETCSTQAFNLFIKAQSVSTPFRERKDVEDKLSMAKKSTPINFNNSPEPKCPVQMVQLKTAEDGTVNISPECPDPLPYKQLSTIMETSETNTLTTGSTKSSVDTHFSFGIDQDNILKPFEFKNKTVGQDSIKLPKSEVSGYKSAHKSIEKNLKGNLDFPQVSDEIKKSEDMKALPAPLEVLPELPELTVSSSGDKPKQKNSDDTTLQINMKSIQIFEDKTETVPKLVLKRKCEKNNEFTQDDFYNSFVKTPEKKQTVLTLPAKTDMGLKTGFEINDSMTFSKLTDMTLPKLHDNSKFHSDSPLAKIGKFSFINNENAKEKSAIQCNLSMKANIFEEQLPTLPNLLEFTLPKYPEKQSEVSFKGFGEKSKRLSFLEKSSKIFEDDVHLMMDKNKSSSKEKATFDISQKKCDEFTNSKKSSNLIMASNAILKKTNKSLIFHNSKEVFEDNVQTDAFGLHISSIKNSTFLPKTQPEWSEQIKEKSLHIKQEKIEEEPFSHSSNLMDFYSNASSCGKGKSLLISKKSENRIEPQDDVLSDNMRSLALNVPNSEYRQSEILEANDSDDLGRSIYDKYTFKTPVAAKHMWSEDEECTEEFFVHHRGDNLDQTHYFINKKVIEANVNPFSVELTKAFLESIEFTCYLSSLESCELKGKIFGLKKGDEVRICDNVFTVAKIIGEGSFGTIYSAKDKSGKTYALKQEKPANLWEYYVCLELGSRLQNTNILPGFMNIQYALIGNNASIFVSEYSAYGSFITVCNAYKRKTSQNLDEYVVMLITSQMLSIIDHLHASQMIHADIKPDNFLLMKKLSYPSKELAIQLIDFGIAIDMKLYPKNYSFTYKHTKEDFKCIEMLENRPWTYQTDLFGVAGTIHVLLYGKYMDVQKNLSGLWAPKQKIPRYLNKSIWEPVFQNLLNIRDCNSMPNLQNLRTMIEETLADKEKYVNEKVAAFNLSLQQ